MELNGIKYEYPTKYSELKTKHYQRIVKEWERDEGDNFIEVEHRDFFKLFTILTDSKFDAFVNTLENQVKIESKFAWIIFEDFRFKTDLPEALEFNGQLIDIPKAIKQLSIGANIKARQTLDKAMVLVNDKKQFINCDCYSMLVAIYLQPFAKPHTSGGFHWATTQELEKEIAEMPIEVIRPIGFFLLNHVYVYGMKQEKDWKQIPRSLKRKFRKMLQG